MVFAVGTKFGVYEIEALLGTGGMGEVYRARDSKLDRDVALKVLPREFLSDTERLARLTREAQVLASLNHPRIASIYGLEESNGTRALVMELVPGLTLAERIAAGPIPLDETLPVARQIAEAMEYAHERGVIHRDLKPANVKLTSDGAVKVLDFGLAKAMESEKSESETANSPTLTIASTRAGVLIGTAAYMSPEQARGKRTDRRSDIWAFGCLLFEMLTGKAAFCGETVSDTLAEVIKEEPDWILLPAETPLRLRELLQRCLQKNPQRRLQAIGDARIELEEAAAGPEISADAILSAEARKSGSRRPLLLAGLAGLLCGSLLAAGVIFLAYSRQALSPPVRLSIALAAPQMLNNTDGQCLAISPDGTLAAYVAAEPRGLRQIWVRRLDDYSAKPVPGTAGAQSPFFSPDGQWLGFFVGHRLEKVAVAGGLPQVICSCAGVGTGTWASDGVIYYAGEVGPLMRVRATGGSCEQVTAAEEAKGELSLFQPQMLPGGETLLITIKKGFSAEQSSVGLISLKSGRHTILFSNATNPHYVAPGFLVFGRSGTIWAVPFDLKRLRPTGNSAPLIEGMANNDSSSYEQFDLSDGGTLLYAAGNESEAVRQVVEADRNGKTRVITTESRPYEDLSLSPDGRHLALTIEGPMWGIWTFDLQRNTLTRLTFEEDNRDPVWSADSRQVVYASLRNGHWGLYVKAADGEGSDKALYTTQNWLFPSSFSPDGKSFAFVQQEPTTGADCWTMSLESGNAAPFLKTPFTEWFPQYSPDSRWIVYESNETGRPEIYVQSARGSGGKWQVSSEGGMRPVWPRDSKEIYYLNGDKVMAVAVQTAPTFTVGTPRELFEGDFFRSGHYFDASSDGQHFFFIKSLNQTNGPTQINTVLNWSSDLKKMMKSRENP